MSRPISRVLSWTIIHLGQNVAACLKQPTRSQRGSRHMETYLVLLRVGFTLPLLLPAARCALTAPFHPYLYPRTNHRRSALCGTFRRLSPPRCYLALYPLEPGLSSALHPFKRKRILESSVQRLPSQLTAEFTTERGVNTHPLLQKRVIGRQLSRNP